jgi:Fur family ferric uptake transcriptional regulator
MTAPDVSDQLRLAGLRVTAPRQSVLQWLVSHPHATAEQIRSGVTGQLGSVSTQAVYDVLAACTEAGLVRRIEPAGHPARFERRTGDNHHHLVCRSCGHTEDVDCAVSARPLPDAQRRSWLRPRRGGGGVLGVVSHLPGSGRRPGRSRQHSFDPP